MTFISGMWFHTFSTTVFKTVVKNVLDRQTLCFTVANFRQYLNEEQKMAVYYKSRMKIAAPEQYWRLPSLPIVRKKHAICLCKLAKCPNPLFFQGKIFALPKTRHKI